MTRSRSPSAAKIRSNPDPPTAPQGSDWLSPDLDRGQPSILRIPCGDPLEEPPLLPIRGYCHSELMLPNNWTATTSRAIEAYRYHADREVLQIVYRDGRKAYDFPCDHSLYAGFLAAGSKGRYVQHTLRPHARRMGWTLTPYRLTQW